MPTVSAISFWEQDHPGNACAFMGMLPRWWAIRMTWAGLTSNGMLHQARRTAVITQARLKTDPRQTAGKSEKMSSARPPVLVYPGMLHAAVKLYLDVACHGAQSAPTTTACWNPWTPWSARPMHTRCWALSTHCSPCRQRSSLTRCAQHAWQPHSLLRTCPVSKYC